MLYLLTVENRQGYFWPSARDLRFMPDERAEKISGAFKAKIMKREILMQWEQEREEFIPVSYNKGQFKRVVTRYLDTPYEEWCKAGINHNQVDEGSGFFRFEREIPYEVWLLETDDTMQFLFITTERAVEDDYYYAGKRIDHILAFDYGE